MCTSVSCQLLIKRQHTCSK